ncbi:hypothetical protein, partial [Brachyspira pilosicoli]|uniref:hypothetical protein n=1 Tax=Brachyspira pilosicoli TaxID=52584 RepID=UPI0012F6C3F6
MSSEIKNIKDFFSNINYNIYSQLFDYIYYKNNYTRVEYSDFYYDINSDAIINDKINKRIEKLLELSVIDGLNKDNVNISEKKIREFLSFIKLYEYPQAISLDEDGYFSLEIKRN